MFKDLLIYYQRTLDLGIFPDKKNAKILPIRDAIYSQRGYHS